MKMKKMLVIAAFICAGTGAYAQTATPPPPLHRFSLQLGNAIPLGDFRSNNFEEDYPPFARGGSMLSAGYARTVRPYLALGATAGWRFNNFDLDAFVATDDELVQSKRAKDWQSGFVLADVYLQPLLGEEATFYVKGSLGASFNGSASLSVETTYGTIERASDKATALAWGVAGGAQVPIVPRLSLNLETSFLATRTTFEVKDKNGSITTYKQAMNSLQLSVGVSYTL